MALLFRSSSRNISSFLCMACGMKYGSMACILWQKAMDTRLLLVSKFGLGVGQAISNRTVNF